MILLDGKKLADKILKKIEKEIKKKRLKLKLAVVLIGENIVSQSYINKKRKACEKTGIGFQLFRFPANINEEKLKKEIKKIGQKRNISGIVIQLPLPKNLNTSEILSFIPEKKDVDVLSPISIAKFWDGTLKIRPPLVKAIDYFLKEYKIFLKNKKIVVVGSGRLVGRPLSIWLLNQGADFVIVNKLTKNISSIVRKADIVISGTGVSKLIDAKMIKKGAVIIDAGTSVENGKTVGDINFESVSKKAAYLTPVPGGVGPMTVACLLENLIILNKKK